MSTGTLSLDTINDLVVCARHVLPQLNAKAVVAVAKAIAEAEGEIERVKALPAVPAEKPPEAPSES